MKPSQKLQCSIEVLKGIRDKLTPGQSGTYLKLHAEILRLGNLQIELEYKGL